MSSYDSAVKPSQQVLIIQETILGLEHRDTLVSMSNLAYAGIALGDPTTLGYPSKPEVPRQDPVELEAPLGGLLWVRVLIFALYFGADLCTPYHCVSSWNLQSYMYISSALCAHSSTMKSAYTTNLTSSTWSGSSMTGSIPRKPSKGSSTGMGCLAHRKKAMSWVNRCSPSNKEPSTVLGKNDRSDWVEINENLQYSSSLKQTPIKMPPQQAKNDQLTG